MSTNLFPAILLAGPPNSGKSVLSYLLTMRLREAGIDHYLVRAAPDGEGDWYLQGDFQKVQPFRIRHKGEFTKNFIDHMIERVKNRLLPLLVDIGGAPRESQWDILRACTHSVLLYKSKEDLAYWQPKLAALELFPIAELCSDLYGADTIKKTHPVLQATVGGLSRQEPCVGLAFGALLDRIAGICHYDRAFLEAEHLRHVPGPIFNERKLALTLGLGFRGENPWWEAYDLLPLLAHIPAGKMGYLYGRGPVWLAAAVGIQMRPEPCWIFDTNLGWRHVPEVVFASPVSSSNINVLVKSIRAQGLLPLDAHLIDMTLTDLLDEPGKTFLFPEIGGDFGVILSGKLPRWLFAALARKMAGERPWVAVHIPREAQALVIFSRVDRPQVGDILAVGE